MADREGKEEIQDGKGQPKASSTEAADADDGSRQAGQQISGALHSLFEKVQGCQYEFAEYFVAWQGVLTVAFSGTPPPLCQLKQNINDELDGLIAQESPGSKWPKISLGCLRDNKTLGLEQLYKLRKICTEESPNIAATAPVLVDNLSVVFFANCCLEKTITVATTPLAFPVDLSRPTNEETALVRQVLSQFALENVDSHHIFTSKNGNRSAHYRNRKLGGTVVHFMKSIPLPVARFRDRVDFELPGMYDWFRDDSLHITVRVIF